MFEKSLYDLIRGLRNHKGRERAYIQDSIKECRSEIKGSDMDLKATALIKLTYLEMFGNDMSWAAFNVLEVMSSSKYVEKRIGYLAAVQSFRPDTEVLMLAENLLKKDLMSPSPPTIAVPLIAIPHLVSPSMANSLLGDILPRLTHSHASIRKKTAATLYRLALVYPDTLRPAWPRMKERLLDENEDPGVTAAIVNVVCELGWRRPQDFLPLAPRLFDLLVFHDNKWMAIKIIKLFATLTPLEPRLVKKLLPPLTTLIKTTPAMSLLYECINGIIQGGIMESASGTTEGDEIARLCVGKLRGMLSVEDDPNLKYVALLAFNKIVESHPHLVSYHEDIIMECIDDPDVSIRLKALDLAVGMVNASNLTSIIERLMRQLQDSPLSSNAEDPLNDRGFSEGVEPLADSDEEAAEQGLRGHEARTNRSPPLPDEYRATVIERVLQLCALNTYANISDFDWYLDILVALVRCVPAAPTNWSPGQPVVLETGVFYYRTSLAEDIGIELRNVAVRVKSSRQEATQAAEKLIASDQRYRLFPAAGNGGQGVLGPAAWIVGEFAGLLTNPSGTLDSLLMAENQFLQTEILSVYIQAAMKVFSNIAGDEIQSWTSERKTMITLLLARLTHWLEPLTSHASLEIQERSVEFLELARLTTEAVKAHAVSEDGEYSSPPLLLTQAIPSLFTGMELNPVAKDAQQKVPIPEDLDLDAPINENLAALLNVPEVQNLDEDGGFHRYYYERPQRRSTAEPAANLLPAVEHESYQRSNGTTSDPEAAARRRAERKERYKDDPFYIPSEETSGTATPIERALRASNGEDFDVDSIPVMELNLENTDSDLRAVASRQASFQNKKKPPRRTFEILADDDIAGSGASGPVAAERTAAASKRSLLQVDSSGLGALSLDESAASSTRATQLDVEKREAEEAEMAAAMQEVERLRLQMQRAQELVESKGESTVVRKKVKKKRQPRAGDAVGETAPADTGSAVAAALEKPKKKKKKVKERAEAEAEAETGEAAVSPKKRKKKRREAVIEEEPPAAAAAAAPDEA